MPRQRIEQKLDKSYWTRFLREMNLVGPIMEEMQEMETQKPSTPQPSIEPELQIFVNRVASKLMPGDPRLREKIRKGLEDTLLGKRNFNDWFNNTGADLGIHSYNLLKVLYDALDGLTSPEAHSLQEQYQMAMRKMASL